MSREEKDKRFIKRCKVLILVFGLLSLVNIVILIGRNSSYALFRRTVSSKRIIEIHVASEFPSKNGVEALKKKLGEGGLIGIPTTCSEESCNPITDKNADKSTIREYRYSGSDAKNYVTFNDEKWRIIGIFKDDAGNEHMKIVRNEVLKYADMPDTYVASGKTYKIRYSSSSQNAYWDYDGSNYDNNWGDAGLMNWLNSKGTEDGYLKKLSEEAQGMIEKTKWYLGTVTYLSSHGINDTTVEAYKYERAITGCSGNKGPSANSSQSAVESNSTCRVWANNAAYWEGEIGLMYPSDYGFASDSSNWSTKKLYDDYSTYITTNWLFKEANHSDYEWFLSPSSYVSGSVARWCSVGYVDYDRAYYSYGVRPVLYLKSTVQITGNNDGSSTAPYTLSVQ